MSGALIDRCPFLSADLSSHYPSPQHKYAIGVTITQNRSSQLAEPANYTLEAFMSRGPVNFTAPEHFPTNCRFVI